MAGFQGVDIDLVPLFRSTLIFIQLGCHFLYSLACYFFGALVFNWMLYYPVCVLSVIHKKKKFKIKRTPRLKKFIQLLFQGVFSIYA